MALGGFRIGSGRSKSGYYNGIYCGSTYELCWIIHSLDHQIAFRRFPGRLEADGLVYYPDFLLSDEKTIIETKGYEKQSSVDKKTKLAESFGYTVKVLRKNDLKYAFDYVESKFKTKEFYKLYDEYKPKYKYTCDFCRSEFETDVKRNTKIKFCKRVCAGRYRKTYCKMTDEIKKKISKALLNRKDKYPAISYKRTYKQIWITNEKISTRIKEDAIIPLGFRRGRISRKES